MDFTMILVFLHLMAACAAIGTIMMVDLRVLSRIVDYNVVIAPPYRFEIITIVVSLSSLYVTGAALVLLGLADRPDFMDNGKLQGKLLLVLMLTANAFVLHRWVFPVLQRAEPISAWTRRSWMTVALAASFSSSAWFFIAFLGMARAWNFVVTPGFVLLQALLAWGALCVLVNVFLLVASRTAPASGKSRIAVLKSFCHPSGKLPRS